MSLASLIRVPSPFGDMAVEWSGHVLSCRPVVSGDSGLQDPGDAGLERELEDMLALRMPLPEEAVPVHPRFPGLWQAVWEIPVGETRSYGDLCRRIGLPASLVRAVARALGTNDLCLLIPCHRVIRKDGSLGGYRWGEALKKRILDYERSLVR